MSFAGVRPYFRARCEALGYLEHKDPFGTENIARPSGKKMYFIKIGDTKPSKLGQSSMDLQCAVEVELFTANSNDILAIEAAAREDGEALISSAMNTARRTSQTTFKNVIFDSMAVEKFSNTNDNAAVAKLSFTVQTVLGL